MEGSSPVDPGGQFSVPATSDHQLLAFRCAPAIRPYLEGESTGAFIVDAFLTHMQIAGSSPFTSTSDSNEKLDVSISVNGRSVASGQVPLNSNGTLISFPLSKLKAQKDAQNVTCVAKSGAQTFQATNTVSFMPKPSVGSVTKHDLLTGALLVQNGPNWDPVFPIGFYTDFDGYLATNLSVLAELKEQG